MKITFDPAKRDKTLAERGLDFAEAEKIFAGDHATWLDDRRDYTEARMITAGWLDKRMVIFVWTQRGASRRVISMRHRREKEQRKIKARFGPHSEVPQQRWKRGVD